MSWKPIVVGVDASPEAAEAVLFAVDTAKHAGTTFHLVHATSDAVGSASAPGRDPHPTSQVAAEVRAEVVHALGGRVPAAALEGLELHPGRPAEVLGRTVARLGAELVVLGGKHHSVLGRWLGGSTSLDVARETLVPMLVAMGRPVIRRVLVVVDLSSAARPTLATAERYAALFGAELRAMSVLEPLFFPPEAPQPDPAEYQRQFAERLAQEVWPLIRTPGVRTVLRHGAALEGIQHEVAEWRPDLLVAGSHGKGWSKRVLVGSVTEGLINHLPTSLLVVPTAAMAGEREVGWPAYDTQAAPGGRPRR